MNGNPEPFPVVVITGPTASGKTGLALELAERYGGEIICADSRTVYKGMDIGTAKPTSDEQTKVRHYLLDVVKPDAIFTTAEFKKRADEAIASIRKRGKLPFLVGGTGLYIDSVVLDYRLGPPADRQKRTQLEQLNVEELQQMIRSQGFDMPENLLNKRHLVRTIERAGAGKSARQRPDGNTIVVAISTDKDMLEQRIRKRAGEMLEQGVIDEAKSLAVKYGWSSEAMSGNSYPILRRVINGELTVDEAIELFVIRDRQLAKRQVTWLKRHDFVVWKPLTEARSYLVREIEHRLSSRNVIG